MDHDKLDKILSADHTPSIDDNARKRSVNLAVSEFKMAQNEKTSKTFQGNSFLSRLMGRTTQKGENKMETKQRNKLMYGGMATAFAVIVVGGLSLSQLDQTVSRFDQQKQEISAIPAGANVSREVDSQAAAAYITAVEETNEQDTIQQESSACLLYTSDAADE